MKVKLGLLVVEVEAKDRAEAVRLARIALCDEWPRMYDLIVAADESKFKVE